MNSEVKKFEEVIHKILSTLIPVESSIALFDFPDYSNVGDSAIWLGEQCYLTKRLNVKFLAVDSLRLLDKPLPVLPPAAIVLISGGGNLGDLYPLHQALREKLITSYKNHRVIQLPQSIHFKHPENEQKCSQVFNSHKDFHLLIRDHKSFSLAEKIHTGPNYLCPDMAFCLGNRFRPCLATYDIMALIRSDKEKISSDRENGLRDNSVLLKDWVDDEPDSPMKILVGWLEKLHSRYPSRLTFFFRVKKPLYNLLAKERLRRGENLLSSGRVVITDRLHGHILCVLMGIPHVIMDNSYGKVGNFRAAWKSGGEHCLEAQSVGDAVEKAASIFG